MEEDIKIDTTDQISQLPEFIVHHILSFMDTPVNLVRMSVLSKKWFALTASFPILDFDIHKFVIALHATGFPFTDGGYVRDTFLKYVAYTMSRFCEQNVSAHTLNLIMVLQEPTHVDIIDKWIWLILKKGVQELVINIQIMGKDLSDISKYRLPNIFLSASSLTSLTIRRCELPSSLMVDAMKFKSLKRLELNFVFLDEEVIKRLNTICPLLEELRVQYCYGFSRFCVYSLQNLQKVWIFYKSGVERIDIEAPNLCCLFLMGSKRRGAPCLNLASCKNLTTLSYCGYPSPSFADFSSNFPSLENLFLGLSCHCNNLKLSSYSLKKFVLLSKCDLDKIDINAPNLLLFVYNGHSRTPYSLVRESAELKTVMECYLEDDDETLWFQKLRRFLDKKSGFKVLKLHVSMNLKDVEELKVIQSAPYELEHVEIGLDNIEELLVYVAVVDAVLWCCRPRSLTLKSKFPFIGFEERGRVVKYTYEKLLQQEDQDLTNIHTVLSPSSKASRHFSNLKSLLTALPCGQEEQIITFIKKHESRIME